MRDGAYHLCSRAAWYWIFPMRAAFGDGLGNLRTMFFRCLDRFRASALLLGLIFIQFLVQVWRPATFFSGPNFNA